MPQPVARHASCLLLLTRCCEGFQQPMQYYCVATDAARSDDPEIAAARPSA